MEHLIHPPSWGLCILLVLLAAMHSCSSSATKFTGYDTDRLALLDIKHHMNDPNGFLNSWNDSHHHCRWSGVSCNIRHGRVTSLILQGKSLSGTISPHIGNLSFMNFIRLDGNGLQGEIPQWIGQLSRLRFFNLSNNLLTGEIPVNISKCSNLRYIDLINNHLTGEIPSGLGSLTKLELLKIGHNNLTGKIPISLGNLSSSLITLSLGYNNLEGNIPNEIGLLSRLDLLRLSFNKLRGEIPPSLFNISSLTSLVAADNFLSGKLPTSFGLNLPNLLHLELGGNNFFGDIPFSITNCTNLITFDLGENNFQGKIPPGLAQLLNLHWLYLSNNSLHGNVQDLLVPLTNCSNLIQLSLNSNYFSGELPNTIGNLSSKLTSIDMISNKISGRIPMELGNLVKLEYLDLGLNSLTGTIPENMAKLWNLNLLDISMNRLSGQIPPALCSNITNLYDLQLNDNSLKGGLGRSLAKCQSLTSLTIDGNKLSGSIPSGIFGSFISPITLHLSRNSLNGTIPPEIGKLTNLQFFDVSSNTISGDCPVIEFLDMHNNHFSGSIPLSLASLKGMRYIDLSNNTLVGLIPGNLSHNDLEGEVPTYGVFSNVSQVMLQGNTKLCGGISELGLPPCPVVHRKRNVKKYLKIILIPLISALVISITLFMYLCYRKRSNIVITRTPSLQPTKEMLRVSYHDLYRATNDFSQASLIGSASFGFVYKGCLVIEHGETKIVAVKVLDLQKRGASNSFMAECKNMQWDLKFQLKETYIAMEFYCLRCLQEGDLQMMNLLRA